MSPPSVFICYSSQDHFWKKFVLEHLGVLQEEGDLDLWHDGRIPVGEDWREQIEVALKKAAAAVFLISPSSLNSRFIRDEELPRLFEKREKEGLLLVPLVVRPCAIGAVTWLKRLELRPKGKALSQIPKPKREELLSKLVEEIAGRLCKPATRNRDPAASFTTGAAPADVDVRLTHLPPGTENFVGRGAELQHLDDAWAAGEAVNVFSLVAFGGVGKTALVNAWIKSLRARDWAGAERVFGWSFYSQGTRDAPASADPFFQKIFPWLGVPAEEIPQDADTRGEALAELLGRQRTLLILDGLEPLQQAPPEKGGTARSGRVQDPALAAFLRSLVFKNPGLCLITTRVPLAETADYTDSTAPRLDLERLGPTAGVALLERYGVKGLTEEKEKAVATLDGHALALTLAGTYLRDFEGGEIGNLQEVPLLTEDTEEGRHARRMMAAYAERLGEPERCVLRLLGLFDRPVGEEVLQVLRQEPPIPGLTEGLTVQEEPAWKRALVPLRKAKLIVADDGGFTAKPTLDAHPLVREYFGERLRQNHPDAWREANDRLYQWYCKQPKDQPDTLEEMLPLYQAVVHGCRAGKHQEAFDEVYWQRIQRGQEFYSTKKLGAISSELVALAALFEHPWGQPAPGLEPTAQAFLLNEAAFDLRAVGRLWEAVEPMRVSMEMDEDKGEWQGAAISANNLSELLLTLGDVEDAVTAGRRAVELAEESEDLFLRMGFRTTLADALHQGAPPPAADSAEAKEAAALFAEAEALQKERQPEYPRLYSLQGYRYCDLLLGEAPDREAAEAVRERATQTLEWAEQHLGPLDVALDHLTLGRAAFHLALLGEEDFPVAAGELDAAVAGLRQAGDVEMIVPGLLARARLYRELEKWDKAARDLEEVRSIAERGSMRLHLADYHLEAAELARGRGDSQKAGEHEGKARELIEATGYRRKSPLLSPL